MFKKLVVLIVLTIVIAIASEKTIAALSPDQLTIPQLLNYQGKLTDISGNPVRDSLYSITFRFFSAATGGTAIWTETQSIQTHVGLFNALLGSSTSITAMPSDGNCYLEMQVNPNPAMTPRIRMASAAYAFLAKKADTANYATNAPLTRPITPPVTTNEITDDAVTNVKLGADAVTTDKILNGTILRADVANNFTAPFADTAYFARGVNVLYVDSARVAVNAYNAKQLQGKDTTALSAKFVDEGQANSITSSMITDNTIVRNDVATNFKSPNADSADYVRNINVPYVDSARVAVNAYNAKQLQGKDTTALSAKFIDEGQANAISTAMIIDSAVTTAKIKTGAVTNIKLSADAVSTDKILDGTIGTVDIEDGAITADKLDRNSVTTDEILDSTITRADIVRNFKAPNADSADYVKNVSIPYVDSARVAVNAYNAKQLQGKDTTALSAKFVDEGQTNSITSSMITDNTIVRNDVATNFKSPNADSADYVRNISVPYVDSARVAVNAYNAKQLQGKDTTALSAKFIDEGQTAGGDLTGTYPNPTITNNAVNTAKIADTNVTMAKIQQAGATNGQILKWNGSTWMPGNDSTGSGVFLPLAGGTMTGAITNTGDPAITMGKGNFGTGNSNTGTDAFVAGLNDTASGNYSTVGGGRRNKARGQYSVVSGGGGASAADSNSARGDYSAIGGGYRNTASAIRTTVGGGFQNTASVDAATVAGGYINTASNGSATVAGGNSNVASGNTSAIGGGFSNIASGGWGTIAGGSTNTASGDYATVSGGWANTASLGYAVVGGGEHNIASAYEASVGGGSTNTASGDYSTVGGGRYNKARSAYSVVAGGGGATEADSNSAIGNWSAIPGGRSNTSSGIYSFAAGRRAKANHTGTFVWADSTNADFTSTGANQFLIRANGNVGINTNSPSSPLTVNGIIQSTTGGIKFPDNSVQTTAATSGGTVTSVGTGAGLTGGPITTSGTISIADNGVTTSKITDSAVTSAKILNGTITGDDIAKPLTLQGSASWPNAILRVRNNGTGRGISIDSAGFIGLYINYSFTDGVNVKRADQSGLWIDTAGGQGIRIANAASDGVGIDEAGYNGLYVMHAGDNGVKIDSAESYGVYAYGGFAGGNFVASNNAANGLVVHSYGDVSSDTALQVYGAGYATGGFYTGGLKSDKSAPCLISPELGIVAAGTGTLSNGRAEISFNPLFTENIRTDVPIRITVTPKGRPAGFLYVAETKSNGFKVEIEMIPGLEKNATDISFDWIAFGTLKDYETSATAQAQWRKMIQERAVHQAEVKTQREQRKIMYQNN